MKSKKLHFDAHLPNLLREVLNNPTCGILKIPINITRGILGELAELAIEIDDPRLHVMMLRLGMYDVSADKRTELIKEIIAANPEQFKRRRHSEEKDKCFWTIALDP
jgi:hypothetical protein